MALVLLLSDALLAFAMWQVAFVLASVVGRGALSEVAIASGAIVPLVVVWVGIRAALGLYPGYGLGNTVEELRRQTVALFATVGIIAVFAFATKLGNALSRPFLFGWAVGLLLIAPVVRHYVKASLGVGDQGPPRSHGRRS